MRNYVKIIFAELKIDSPSVTWAVCAGDDDNLNEYLLLLGNTFASAQPAYVNQRWDVWFKMNKERIVSALNSAGATTGIVYSFTTAQGTVNPWVQHGYFYETAFGAELRRLFLNKSPRKKGKHG